MKRRCYYCGKTLDDEVMTQCPSCQHQTDISNLDEDGIHELHRNCHAEINKNDNLKNGGLTFIVIGSILLIIGAVFLVLSFRYNVRKVRVFTPGSVEFVMCVIALTGAVTLLTWGTIRLVKALTNLKFFRKTINDTKK